MVVTPKPPKRKVGRPPKIKTEAPEKKKRGRKPNAQKPASWTNALHKGPLQDSPVISERTALRPPAKLEPPLLLPSLPPPRVPLVQTQLDGTLRFVEPQLALPTPGIAGHALEDVPPPKIRRPAGRGRKPRARAASEEIDDTEFAARESAYVGSLQTPELDTAIGVSELRTDLPQPRRRGRPRTRPIVPRTPQLAAKPERTDVVRSAKRLKIISPKKPGSLLVPPPSAPPTESDSTTNNDDFCSTCGGTGIFICCDSCPKSFHLLCCNPPLEDVPDDNWNCDECRAAQGLVKRHVYLDVGMFGPLISAVHGKNSSEFRLPKRLRDATFIDVSTGDDHKYNDLLLKPDVPYSKVAGRQIPGFNRDEDLDIDSLYDKNGRPHLCHKCKLSGLHRRTIVLCDYCPLRWHVDCLPGVVVLAKTLGHKWRCPNHVESILQPQWLERRSFKDTLVLDAAAHNKFLRCLLANNFIIKHSDQPYLAQTKPPLLVEYFLFQKEDFVSPNTDFVEDFNQEFGAESSDNEPEVPEYKIPEHLQNYATNGKIVAKGLRKLARILSLTNADDPEEKAYIYRVPEQQILIDFMDKGRRKQDILDNIRYYDDSRKQEQEKDREAVEALMQIQKQGEGEKIKEEHRGNGSVKETSVADISPEELLELMQIKRLIEQRGKNALRELLQS